MPLQIARGLAAAHARGIVHRDLKPENIFVTRDGRVKILDFGLAKLTLPADESSPTVEMAGAHTATGVVLGTVGYMSPEQVQGRAAGPQSDIFSFGAVLYEMLSRRRAFSGDTALDTLNAIVKNDPPEAQRCDAPGAARAGANRRPVSRERSRPAISVGAGPRVRARGGHRSVDT